jgi:hypothetical protein
LSAKFSFPETFPINNNEQNKRGKISLLDWHLGMDDLVSLGY